MEPYTLRYMDAFLEDLLGAHPAVMLVGPRGAGKTTTAMRHAKTIWRLDDPRQAGLFASDPDRAIQEVSSFPLLLDEWQAVPDVLGAVKRDVDARRGAGRFLLTGSVRAPFAGRTWPGTGRVIEIPMSPLSVAERFGKLSRRPFLGSLASGDLPRATDAEDIVGYVDLALAGGFPETVALPPDARYRWLGSYIDLLVGRELQDVGYELDPRKLRAYLTSYAANSAGACDHATIYRPADINHRTAQRYEALLQSLYIVSVIPSWNANPLQRLVHQPKRFIADTGLWARLLNVRRDQVLRNGDLIGRLLETFVLSQIRSESALDEFTTLSHIRTRAGRQEVDLIAELNGGGIVGIEVKATSAPKRDDARHLIWLRDELGADFLRGAVLHTGPYTFELEDRILAVPICAIWA